MTTNYRNGAVGALVDEHERAVGEFARLLETISDEEFLQVRDTETNDDDCRSIHSIVSHVIASGYGYAGMLRTAWGIEHTLRQREPLARSEAGAKLNDMLHYMSQTMEGRWDLSEENARAMQMTSRWGPVCDFEQVMEHAIVHVLRHRRQIERFLAQP